MHYNAPTGLPANPESVDQGTFNPNLPTGNDIQVYLTPGPRAQDIARYCVGAFRKAAQDRVGRTKVHNIIYNLLAQNYFQNQVFQEWCQRTVDYAELMIVTQNMHPQQAADAASLTMYASLFSTIVAQYFQVLSQNQMLTQQMVEQANKHAAEFEQIQRALIQFKQQPQGYGAPGYAAPGYAAPGYAPPAPQYGQPAQHYGAPPPQYGQPPQQAYLTPGSYNVSPQGAYNTGGGGYSAPPPYAPSPLELARQGAAPAYSAAPASYYNTSAAPTGSPRPAGGSVDDHLTVAPIAPPVAPQGPANVYQQPAVAPLKPMQTFGTHTEGRVITEVSVNRNMAPVIEYSSGASQAQPNVVSQLKGSAANMTTEDLLDAPSNLEEIKVDPAYFRPAGAPPINPQRPFDLVYNPGGVEIRPAHQIRPDEKAWKRTWSVSSPYTLNFVPHAEIKFLVKWPDGLVQELITPVEPGMEYLRNELLPRLKVSVKQFNAEKTRPDTRGVVELDHFSDEVVKPVGSSDLVKVPEVITVETRFAETGRPLELAEEAANAVRDEYELLENSELPCYEYTSVRDEAMVFGSKADRVEVQRLGSAETLSDLAREMLLLINNGALPDRHARLLNDRMTLAVNRMCAENLALPNVQIDNFIDDIDELMEHLVKKCGNGILQTVATFTPNMLAQWMNLGWSTKDVPVETEEELAEGEEPATESVTDYDALYVIDTYVTLQTNFNLDDLANLDLSSNTPVLLSKVTQPNLFKLVVEYISRNKEPRHIGKHLVIATKDGVYLDVVIGWLRTGAVLLKRRPVAV